MCAHGKGKCKAQSDLELGFPLMRRLLRELTLWYQWKADWLWQRDERKGKVSEVDVSRLSGLWSRNSCSGQSDGVK